MTSTMKPLVFTDLDDTIFVNQRKLPAGFSGSFVTAVTDTDDRVSVMTAKQNSFFRWIIHTADVVPITARSYEAFKRIDLDFGHNWKIAGNGSVVINPANEIDRQWTRIMAAELPEYQACLQDKLDEALAAARALGLDVTVKRYAEHGHDHCVLLVLNGERSHELHRIAQSELSDERLHVHFNGGVLAFTARPVSKRRAAEYVMSQMRGLENRVVLGFGDSLSDLGFMSVCDFMGAPQGSQISNTLVAA
jgi:hydroxymethylpyrimidine pyrophosphatase-like HAD family hydrolase